MRLLDESSLAITVDHFCDSYFWSQPLSPSDSDHLAEWLTSRQGTKGSYAGMFAPSEADFRDGIHLFTGERIHTGAATSHILGEESCRILLLLDDQREEIKSSLKRAQVGIFERLSLAESQNHCGAYCCGPCTVSVWRHLTHDTGGPKEHWLSAGMAVLRHSRAPDGTWHRFPFYYTLYGLSEIDPSLTKMEIQYAALTMERRLKRLAGNEPWQSRRRTLLERLLQQV